MDQRYRFHNHGNELIENIQKELGSRFWPEYRLSGVTFYGNKGRILKMVNSSKWLYFEFNVPVPTVDGLEVLTEKEAREKHMGSCRWVYKGNSLNSVQVLIKEALQKY
ncbi:hypothetical protein [Neobacillus rhizophilus]|uniref:Uncharacterized protein n=1 Tax=Neobacillus rhizophilus TaxID=2833579 RepID=A0A942UB54_9BACI|nr:hypothetical protein [Neobacillus rhizophilus]MBS4214924.1 hypothetical protein [Neobacillus rhizophilus]